jgi:uncharacterized protein
MMKRIIIVLIQKTDPLGVVQVTYDGAWHERTATMAVIHATWQRGPRDLGYTVFEPGDRFTEYFYADQCFNILRIGTAADGALKGWYCNISHPAVIQEDEIIYADLYLDVWVAATGVPLVLDEDEFANAELDDATRTLARAGLAEVLRWATEHLGPFAELAA